MIRLQTEQTIARSADDIWVYAADILRHPEWMAVTDVRVIRGLGTQTGTRGRERIRFGPFRWDVEFEVVEAQPGHSLAWQGVDGAPFDLKVALYLEPIGPAATKAIYRADVRLHGLWRVLGPIVASEGKAGPERELRLLKALVEGSPSLAPVIP